MRRPSKKVIERVVGWLAEIDISLYGPNMDTETGQEFPACMDYDVEEAIARHQHIKADTLWREQEDAN